MKCYLPEIRHDLAGFEALARLSNETDALAFDTVEINMQVSWFDADMCAAFGAVLYRLQSNMNDVRLINVSEQVERILSKNSFLSHYGRQPIPDRWGTTIRYQRLEVKDDRYFAAYIEDEFMQRSEMPSMSLALQKKFRESIFEIFSNAVLHSQTRQGIFSCGQFFPKRKRLDFSVADLGVGIRHKVESHLQREVMPENAISWVTQERNTTKSGSVPGGLGLKLLREFIDLNGGCIQIVSDAGYWRREGQKTTVARMPHQFPGTVVSLEINTNDTNSYALANELSPADIF